MSAIEYTAGNTAKERVDELLNGDAALNKIKLDSSVIDCSGDLDFETTFQTLYDETITKLEEISTRMDDALKTMPELDSAMESDYKVDIDYAGEEG